MKSLIIEHLNNHLSSWSLGAFGALGEFSHDQHETLLKSPDQQLCTATARGGIRIDSLEQCSAIAYETLSKQRDHWGQALAFCLPESQARMSGRRGITELGSDTASLLEAHRQQVMFDLGLSTPYVDVCVRTDNRALINALRALEGADILAPQCAGFSHILQHHPHRVFLSRLARLEVYQPIGIEKTPQGPHSHVLPNLLASGLHQAANIPLPDKMIAALTLYPANPCVDIQAQAQPFDAASHSAFQTLLTQYGLADYVQQKQQTMDAYLSGMAVADYPTPANKLQRLAARIALRQAFHRHPHCARLSEWRQRFDSPEQRPAP